MLAHHMLILGAQEFRWYAAFTKWFRHMILVQGTDPTSAAAEEITEKDPGIDYLSLLHYIRDAMVESKLDLFLSSATPAAIVEARPEMYTDLKQVLTALREKGTRNNDKLQLSSYYSAWRSLNSALIEQFTSWQRQTSVIPGKLILFEGQAERADIRMVQEVRRCIK
jgi:hypothetical protein